LDYFASDFSIIVVYKPNFIGSGAAVAIEWTLTGKNLHAWHADGIGEIGKMLIVQQYAHVFDSHPKTAKLFGEFAGILGAASHISTLYLPTYFLILASFGYMMRGIYISIWVATHTIFNKNLALKENNMGDLYAKDESQNSLAHILGLIAGIGLLSVSNHHTVISVAYLLLATTQIMMTFLLVRAADYEVLNFHRMRLVANTFVEDNTVNSCRDLKPLENWIGESLSVADVPDIQLASMAEDVIKDEMISERINILKVSPRYETDLISVVYS
jgi:hypothetical protein